MTTSNLEALQQIGLAQAPVAMAFLDAPPAGLARAERAAAAGCGYWKKAGDGQAFYTTAEDHHNCPVGAYTHGAELPPAKAKELESLVGTMIELRYLRSEEVPTLPHRTQPLSVVAYAPLTAATFAPDVVIFRGNARQIMLLSEAARAAGAFEQGTALGRPACSMVPHAMGTGTGVASVGCIGNRVYTALEDDELYLAVPAAALERTLAELGTVITANVELEKFHRARAAAIQA